MISIQTVPLARRVGSNESCRLILGFRGSLSNVKSPLDGVVPVELLYCLQELRIREGIKANAYSLLDDSLTLGSV
jgi:hypothetical protein